ncbi:hypothetical protein FQR65_LT04317 [Abscondita terminalis]|nr:hypothetical protein FQR65_LT04317 [Abscondita terminalis]
MGKQQQLLLCFQDDLFMPCLVTDRAHTHVSAEDKLVTLEVNQAVSENNLEIIEAAKATPEDRASSAPSQRSAIKGAEMEKDDEDDASCIYCMELYSITSLECCGFGAREATKGLIQSALV